MQVEPSTRFANRALDSGELFLRRRSLYPAELRVHVPENSVFSRVFRYSIVMILFGFLLTDRPVFGLSC